MGDSDDCRHSETDPEFKRVLDETFGIWPDLEVPPREEWDRFDRDWNRISRANETPSKDR